MPLNIEKYGIHKWTDDVIFILMRNESDRISIEIKKDHPLKAPIVLSA